MNTTYTGLINTTATFTIYNTQTGRRENVETYIILSFSPQVYVFLHYVTLSLKVSSHHVLSASTSAREQKGVQENVPMDDQKAAREENGNDIKKTFSLCIFLSYPFLRCTHGLEFCLSSSVFFTAESKWWWCRRKRNISFKNRRYENLTEVKQHIDIFHTFKRWYIDSFCWWIYSRHDCMDTITFTIALIVFSRVLLRNDEHFSWKYLTHRHITKKCVYSRFGATYYTSSTSFTTTN